MQRFPNYYSGGNYEKMSSKWKWFIAVLCILVGLFLLLLGLGIINFNYDKGLQMAIAVGVAGAYITWGKVHHHLHRDLHISVIVEYILIASLGVIVTLSILNW